MATIGMCLTAGIAFQRAGHREAVHVRELDVHEDEVGPMLAGDLEGLDGIRRLKHLEVLEPEGVCQRLGDVRAVLDDENGGLGHR